MDEQPKVEETQIRTIRATPVPDDEYFTAYANGVIVAHTFYDVQLHFSELKVRGPESIVAETFATIMMSPQHAKALSRHLNQNLELYETKYGEIKLPEVILGNETVDFPLEAGQGESV